MNNDCDCDDAQDRLYQFLDSELDVETAASVRRHLEDCVGCHDSFDFERRLKMVVKRHLEEDMPESLELRVRELLRQETAGTAGV